MTQALELIATTFPNKCNAVPDDPNSVLALYTSLLVSINSLLTTLNRPNEGMGCSSF